jgi:hypothetical protein
MEGGFAPPRVATDFRFRLSVSRHDAHFKNSSQDLLSPTGLASNIELLRLGRPGRNEGLSRKHSMRATCPK